MNVEAPSSISSRSITTRRCFAAAGHQAEAALKQATHTNAGKDVCVVEGAIPTKEDGISCMIGGRTALDIVHDVAGHAGAVIAIGSCASWGGIPSADPNPTGAVGAHEVLKGMTVVNIPGCPANPYNFLGTVMQDAIYGTLPALDDESQPKFAHGQTIHEHCPRRAHFDAGRFADKYGDEPASRWDSRSWYSSRRLERRVTAAAGDADAGAGSDKGVHRTGVLRRRVRDRRDVRGLAEIRRRCDQLPGRARPADRHERHAVRPAGRNHLQRGSDSRQIDRIVRGSFFQKNVSVCITHAWDDGDWTRHPWDEDTVPRHTAYEPDKQYSWITAPRFDCHPMQVGPLAQVLVGFPQGHEATTRWAIKALPTAGKDAATTLTPAVLHATLRRQPAAECAWWSTAVA